MNRKFIYLYLSQRDNYVTLSRHFSCKKVDYILYFYVIFKNCKVDTKM